ncbi:hypothetical protein [Rugamonas apoptosis]|uniref:Uncharacterized protein n=1 Tax=Rugamonas apoptosis TaxID=2758570 RepID=A0A7W2IJJ4_9BURK|nr:hypothetical protein [Rugamonas apoptosis]MBA5686835.1 hypothetical protein [Rugamonas apoptosis]
MPYYYPPYVSLCAPSDRAGWEGAGTHFSLQREGQHYQFQVRDIDYPSASDAKRLRQDGTLWIELRGYSAPPGTMLYDPAGAIVEIDGQQVRAMPVVFEGNGAPERAVPTMPVDLARRGLPHEYVHGYYVGFKMALPGRHDSYQFLPGAITLNGVATPLPRLRSCYTPARSGVSPLR